MEIEPYMNNPRNSRQARSDRQLVHNSAQLDLFRAPVPALAKTHPSSYPPEEEEPYPSYTATTKEGIGKEFPSFVQSAKILKTLAQMDQLPASGQPAESPPPMQPEQIPQPEPSPDSRLSSYDFSRLSNPRAHRLRDFQSDAILFALENGNALIKLPTGTGKTEIEFYLAAEALKNGMVLLIADKINLDTQHENEARKPGIGFDLSRVRIAVATGDSRNRKRDPAAFYEDADLVIGTPETIANDIRRKFLDLSIVSLAIFDEVHHAVKQDAYAVVARACLGHAKPIPCIGLSASPAENEEALERLLDLFQTRALLVGDRNKISRYFVRPDVLPKFIKLEETRIEALKLLAQMSRKKIRELMGEMDEAGIEYDKEPLEEMLDKSQPFPRFRDMGALKLAIAQMIEEERSIKYYNNPELESAYKASSIHASIVKLRRAFFYLERCGTEDFMDFASTLEKEAERKIPVLASEAIVDDPLFMECKSMCSALQDHPKVDFLIKLLSGTDDQAIVFVETRALARKLTALINDRVFDGKKLARAYVGKKGMTSREQERIRDEFESGKYKVLVATSAAEEGLHLPMVKVVVNYCVPEMVKSYEQRQGRIRGEGKSFTLVSDTGGEIPGGETISYYALRAKNRKINRILDSISESREGRE